MTAWLPSVRLATTENLDDDGGMPAKLLTPGTLDGKTVNAGDEILAKDETNPILNGTWIAAANPLDPMTRRGDTFEPESTVRVSEGDRNGHTQWACKAQGTIVLDTTPLSFSPQNLVRYVDTQAELVTLKALGAADVVILMGYWSRGDGGGGLFYWDDAITEEPDIGDPDALLTETSADGGTKFFVGPEAGGWHRCYEAAETDLSSGRTISGPAINVRWFGARGDDGYLTVHDDTDAFRRALKVLAFGATPYSPRGGGGILHIPAGAYKLTDTLVLADPENRADYTYVANCTIRGAHRDSTHLRFYQNAGDETSYFGNGIQNVLTKGTNNYGNNIIENITISNANPDNNTGTAIDSVGGTGVVIRNVTTNDWACHIAFDGMEWGVVDNVLMGGDPPVGAVKEAGIYLAGSIRDRGTTDDEQTNHNTITNSKFNGPNIHIKVEAGIANTISDCFHTGAGIGLLIQAKTTRLAYSRCNGDQAYTDAHIKIDHLGEDSQIVAQGLVIDGCYHPGTTEAPYIKVTESSAVYGLTMVRNFVAQTPIAGAVAGALYIREPIVQYGNSFGGDPMVTGGVVFDGETSSWVGMVVGGGPDGSERYGFGINTAKPRASVDIRATDVDGTDYDYALVVRGSPQEGLGADEFFGILPEGAGYDAGTGRAGTGGRFMNGRAVRQKCTTLNDDGNGGGGDTTTLSLPFDDNQGAVVEARVILVSNANYAAGMASWTLRWIVTRFGGDPPDITELTPTPAAELDSFGTLTATTAPLLEWDSGTSSLRLTVTGANYITAAQIELSALQTRPADPDPPPP